MADMFCTGVSAGGKDRCDVDQGGPVINAAGVLVGVITAPGEFGCAQAGFPSVPVRVGEYVSRIDEQIMKALL